MPPDRHSRTWPHFAGPAVLLGRAEQARAAYQRGLALGVSEPQAGHLRRRIAGLRG